VDTAAKKQMDCMDDFVEKWIISGKKKGSISV